MSHLYLNFGWLLSARLTSITHSSYLYTMLTRYRNSYASRDSFRSSGDSRLFPLFLNDFFSLFASVFLSSIHWFKLAVKTGLLRGNWADITRNHFVPCARTSSSILSFYSSRNLFRKQTLYAAIKLLCNSNYHRCVLGCIGRFLLVRIS